MKKGNIIGIVVAAVLIVVAVILVSRYIRRSTPTILQGTVECTTYKASSKIAGRIDDMKVEEGQHVEKGELLYTLSTPELDAKLMQAEAARSAAQRAAFASFMAATTGAPFKMVDIYVPFLCIRPAGGLPRTGRLRRPAADIPPASGPLFRPARRHGRGQS